MGKTLRTALGHSRLRFWLVVALLGFHQLALAGEICPFEPGFHSSQSATAHCAQADEIPSPDAYALASFSDSSVPAAACSPQLRSSAEERSPVAIHGPPPGRRIPASILFCNSRQ